MFPTSAIHPHAAHVQGEAAGPPGAPPPPPTVAPPPQKPARPLLRSAYRRPRKTAEEYKAEREAQGLENEEAARGVTRWLEPEQLAAVQHYSSRTDGGKGVSTWTRERAAAEQRPKKLIMIDGAWVWVFFGRSP